MKRPRDTAQVYVRSYSLNRGRAAEAKSETEKWKIAMEVARALASDMDTLDDKLFEDVLYELKVFRRFVRQNEEPRVLSKERLDAAKGKYMRYKDDDQRSGDEDTGNDTGYWKRKWSR